MATSVPAGAGRRPGLSRAVRRLGALLEALVANYPKSVADLADLTVCHFHLAHAEEALAVGLRALPLAPEEPRIRLVLGLVFSQQGDYAAALGHLEAAAGAAPGAFEHQDVLDFVRAQLAH